RDENEEGNRHQRSAGVKRAQTKIILHIALGAGVGSKISRREKSEEREREQAARERKRRKPPRKKTAHNMTINDANLTSAERAERYALDEWRKETGRAEQHAQAL